MNRQVFVFGSNLAGAHGAGSALEALNNHGAIYGQGIGLQGESYAIPTKCVALMVLPLDKIAAHVGDFIEFARSNPTIVFKIVAIGCGLAGYSPKDIAPMFRAAPANCILPTEFQGAI